MVQGNDTALAWRRSGFDSRWVHSKQGLQLRWKGAGYGLGRASVLTRMPERV